MSYKAIKFVTGQDIMAFVVDDSEATITLKKLHYVLPDQNNAGNMILTPYLPFTPIEEEVIFDKKDVLCITEPYPQLVNMMTKKFSSIIQPSAESSNVAKLIL